MFFLGFFVALNFKSRFSSVFGSLVRQQIRLIDEAIHYLLSKQKQRSNKTGKVPLYTRVYLTAYKQNLNLEVNENDILKWALMSMWFNDRNIAASKLLNLIISLKNFRKIRTRTGLLTLVSPKP